MKNKILSILFIFILFSFLFINNNVFATSSSITEEKRNTIEQLMQEYSDCDTWVSITYRGKDAFCLISSNEEYKLYVSGETLGVCNGGLVQWYFFYYYPDTNTYKLFYEGTYGAHSQMTISTVYSNKNIYADAEGNEIFFMSSNIISIYSLLQLLGTVLLSSITPIKIVTVLALIISFCMTFVLIWFGVKQLTKIFWKGVNKGRF